MSTKRWAPERRGCSLEPLQGPDVHRENHHEPGAYARQSSTNSARSRSFRRIFSRSSALCWGAAFLAIFGVLVISTHLAMGVLCLIAAGVLLSLPEVGA